MRALGHRAPDLAGETTRPTPPATGSRGSALRAEGARPDADLPSLGSSVAATIPDEATPLVREAASLPDEATPFVRYVTLAETRAELRNVLSDLAVAGLEMALDVSPF